MHEQISRVLGLEVSRLCPKGEVFISTIKKCVPFTSDALFKIRGIGKGLASPEEVEKTIYSKIELASRFNKLLSQGVQIHPAIKNKLNQELISITSFLKAELKRLEIDLSHQEEELKKAMLRGEDSNTPRKRREAKKLRLFIQEVSNRYKYITGELQEEENAIGDLTGEEIKQVQNPMKLSLIEKEDNTSLQREIDVLNIARLTEGEIANQGLRYLKDYWREKDPAEVRKRFSPIDEEFKLTEMSKSSANNICKKYFSNDEDASNYCVKILISRKTANGIDEILKEIGALPEDIINSVSKVKSIKGRTIDLDFLSDFNSLVFKNKRDFLKSIVAKLKKESNLDKEITTESEALNILQNLIEKTQDSRIRTKYAEYFAMIKFFEISQNKGISMYMPTNNSQAYFDFIAIDKDKNPFVFPVKFGNEQDSDPGREADSSALLNLIGENLARKEGETNEQYELRVRDRLRELLNDESSNLKTLLKSSYLAHVFIDKNNKLQVSFKKVRGIDVEEGVKGTRSIPTPLGRVREVKNKYKILGEKQSIQEIDDFSSSIQKAVSMLKSSDFSEAKFNKFMRENSWQVI